MLTKCVKSGGQSIRKESKSASDDAQSVIPAVVSDENTEKINNVVLQDRRVTIHELKKNVISNLKPYLMLIVTSLSSTKSVSIGFPMRHIE
jgi:hypothetical protein